MARVKNTDKFGFIDKKGKTVLPFEFDKASEITNGLIWVERNEKKGLIDTKGIYFLGCIYEKIEELGNNILRLEREGKWAYYDLLQKKIIWQEEGFDTAEE